MMRPRRPHNVTAFHGGLGEIVKAVVEVRGFEPLASSLRTKRSTN